MAQPHRLVRLLVAFAAVLLLAAGCGDDSDGDGNEVSTGGDATPTETSTGQAATATTTGNAGCDAIIASFGADLSAAAYGGEGASAASDFVQDALAEADEAGCADEVQTAICESFDSLEANGMSVADRDTLTFSC